MLGEITTMREIKFRGKSGTQWRYGDLYHNEHGELMIYEPKTSGRTLDGEAVDGWRIKVAPETVGQFTGIHDANGREIYEGDVIKLDNEVYTVLWAEYSACWFVDLKNTGPSLFTQYHAGKSIVIGNAHDNPELLERMI